MSNPGVVVLDSIDYNDQLMKRFVIEDNIGEAIHLHIHNVRIDFSIQEFLEFSSMIRESLNALDFLCGYRVEDFDEHFLKSCSSWLPNLLRIEIEEVSLADLKSMIWSSNKNVLQWVRLVPINQVLAFKYLNGDRKDFIKHEQYNYFNMNNETRLLEQMDSIQKHGYPLHNKHIILFNGENIIRDGLHRAAILAYLYGMNYRIRVMRFYFKGKEHLIRCNFFNLKLVLGWGRGKVFSFLRKLKNKLISK